MRGIFSLDGPVGRALERFAALLGVSILWLVCSFPLATIGASTAALYTMTLRRVRNEEGKIVSGFFRAFRENFKKSTLIHLILCAFGALVGFYWIIVGGMPETMRVFFHGASLMFTFIWLMEALFVYPVQARFENTVWNTMKNAWLMAAGNLHIFLLALIIMAAPFMTLLLNTGLFLSTLPVWILLGPGLTAWLNSYLFQHCFRKYVSSGKEEEETEI